MALINCPECRKEISDKAAACPNCGNPIINAFTEQESNQTEILNEELLAFPDLPTDLNIGQQITNWSFDAHFKGVYDRTENVVDAIPHGNVDVMLHTHGICVNQGLTFYYIHNSQIINIQTASKAELAKINKSVIGRAVVGNLIFGPLGAIIGGMSGFGTKDKFLDNQYMIINYWDTKSMIAQTLLISGDRETINRFICRHSTEQQKNREENRGAETNTTPIWAIICVIIIVISLIIAFTV